MGCMERRRDCMGWGPTAWLAGWRVVLIGWVLEERPPGTAQGLEAAAFTIA